MVRNILVASVYVVFGVGKQHKTKKKNLTNPPMDVSLPWSLLLPAQYGKELAAVMKNMVLTGKIATLAREIEKDRDLYNQDMSTADDDRRARSNTLTDFIGDQMDDELEAEEVNAQNNKAPPSAGDAATAFMAARESAGAAATPGTAADNVSVLDGPETEEDFTASEQVQIDALLDAWEEPARAEDTEVR